MVKLSRLAGLAAWIAPDTMWKASERLMDTIRHYASFPATGVSLRQMVQFGDRPSTGMFLCVLWDQIEPSGKLYKEFTDRMALFCAV